MLSWKTFCTNAWGTSTSLGWLGLGDGTDDNFWGDVWEDKVLINAIPFNPYEYSLVSKLNWIPDTTESGKSSVDVSDVRCPTICNIVTCLMLIL